MTRGIGDPAPTPEDNGQDQSTTELDAVINELIKGQNKLHDRIVDLERKLDHLNITIHEGEVIGAIKPNSKWWHKGL